MFKVLVTEVSDSESEVKRYEQTVDAIDLPQLIAAVNRKPRKPREPRAPKAK